ncbi:hypothetical protein N234_09820 [Ralstonia pickettii DTP0602]|nr:hypothetical protein N234_09820 [Ralstonia pickettii DTP0602]
MFILLSAMLVVTPHFGGWAAALAIGAAMACCCQAKFA